MAHYKIENLTFSYPDGKKALDGIELDIKDGEFVTLCGKSGCGKTTLLRHLKPSAAPHGDVSGKIYFDDVLTEEMTEHEQSFKIGYVMQNPENQIVTDKVWHEIAFGCENMGIPSDEIRARVGEMAEFFGFEELFYRDTHSLSGGQKQLLNLAAVMAMRPTALILDEPTGQLDPSAAYDFLQMLKKINSEMGITVILTEHRTEEVFALSDRIIVMDSGKIIAEDKPEKIAEALKRNGMTEYLPSAARISIALTTENDAPITIRDGRRWLSDYSEKHEQIDLMTDKKKTFAETAVELKDVWFRYEKNTPDVLRGLTMTVSKGEILAVTGGNGAGKSTLMSVLSKKMKPYMGKIKIFGKTIDENDRKIGVLSQNPQDMFSKKTVLDELESVDEKNTAEIAKLCGIDGLFKHHPYDLSGGEQQKTALSKLLLLKPEILLLDEPVKGMDPDSKKSFGILLKSLSKSGMTIIMVTHDMEFAAEYADSCAMMFDGMIAAHGDTRSFFERRYFYTTAAYRIADGIVPGAVLTADVIKAFGGEIERKPEPIYKDIYVSDEQVNIPKMAVTARKLSLKNRVAAMVCFTMIPFTIFFGKYILSDRRYYFISLLIILEAFLPFVISFENRKPKPREMVLISVLTAIGVAGRGAFYMLPQFKPVVAIVVISGACLGGSAGFLVGSLTAFVSNFFFGQGIWTPWQMLAFGMVGLISGLVFEKGLIPKKRLPMSLFGGFAAIVIYGGIINPASVIMMSDLPTAEMIISAYLTGFPFDLVQGAATVFFLWLCSEPFVEKLERIKIKYGITE